MLKTPSLTSWVDSNQLEISADQLGTGAFGTVYKGFLKEAGSGRDVATIAVKIANTEHCPNWKYVNLSVS